MENPSEIDPRNKFSILPEPSYVAKPLITLAAATPKNEASSMGHFLLWQQEVRLGEETQRYFRFAIKLNDEVSVQHYSNIHIDFDPSYENLLVHTVGIWRDGHFITKCEKNSFQFIRREPNLEKFLIDGRYTTTSFLADVRAGDVIEYSYTISGDNPVFEGLASGIFPFSFFVPVKQVLHKLHVPNTKDIYRKAYGIEDNAAEMKDGNMKTLTWEMQDIASEIPDSGAPGWSYEQKRIEYSEFNSWDRVAKWASRIFNYIPTASSEISACATTLTKDLGSKAAKLQRLIEFVQDDIRYMGLEIDAHSHKPRQPEDILSKRYGDCKEKSLLLCALLKEINVSASVILVNSFRTRAVTNFLPSPLAFNHAVVHLGGEDVQVIDPTISGQKGKLSQRWIPNYGFGLIVGLNEKNLTEIKHNPETCRINRHDVFTIKDYREPVELATKITYTSWEADNARTAHKNTPQAEWNKGNTEYFMALFGDLEIMKEMTYEDIPDTNTITLESRFRLLNVLERANNEKYYILDLVAYTISTRIPSYNYADRKLPLALSYPLDISHEITLYLPEKPNIKNEEREDQADTFYFSRIITTGKRYVNLKFKFQTLKDVIDTEAYPSERELLEKTLSLSAFRIIRPRKHISWYWFLILPILAALIRKIISM